MAITVKLALLLTTVLALMPSACTTSGGMVTQENNHFVFPTYSVKVPPDQGWQLVRFKRVTDSPWHDPGLLEYADLVLGMGQAGSVAYLIQFTEMRISAEYLTKGTAGTVANRYLQAAEDNLRDLGRRNGWQLDHVTLGEEELGPNHFFTMKYQFQSATHKEAVSLFLHFPRAEENEHFILARYSETSPPGLLEANSRFADFFEALKSLRMDK